MSDEGEATVASLLCDCNVDVMRNCILHLYEIHASIAQHSYSATSSHRIIYGNE